MNGLFLETWRCPDGFELGSSEQGSHFQPRTERAEPLRLEIENLENPVVVEFANARDDSDLIKFFSKFGYLHREPLKAEEGALRILQDRDGVLKLQRGYRRDLLRISADSVEALQALNHRLMVHGKHKVPRLAPKLDLGGEGGALRMLLDCYDLQTFMVMETVTAAMQGAKLGTCDHCSDVFLTGPLTGRRSHAKYCSARCRVAAMRARNQAS